MFALAGSKLVVLDVEPDASFEYRGPITALSELRVLLLPLLLLLLVPLLAFQQLQPPFLQVIPILIYAPRASKRPVSVGTPNAIVSRNHVITPDVRKEWFGGEGRHTGRSWAQRARA